jgi:hypothetical protein
VLITNLFLNNIIKKVNEIFAGWMRIRDAWIPDNWEFIMVVYILMCRFLEKSQEA